jgi:hypothetical protein
MLRINETFGLILPKLDESATQRVTEALLPDGGSHALEVKIAAIHEGLTRNNTFYSKEGLTHKEKNDQGQVGGLESWIDPYGAPILKNHDSAEVDNTIGRVIKAEWVEKEGRTPGHVEITARITDPMAIEKFMRGEYSTGSIGMDVDKAECSICGMDFMKGWAARCEHERGKWYQKGPKGSETEGQWVDAEAHAKGARRMHINIGNVWAREYSVVAVPSDMRSKVKSYAVKEMSLTGEEGSAPLNLLDPAFTETAQAASKELDVIAPNNEDETPTGEEVVTERSVASLIEGLDEADRDLYENDPLTFYFETATALEVLLTGGELSLEEQVMSGDAPLGQAELEKLTSYVFDNNEHLEAELIALQQSVLSSRNQADLSDSAFALVKVVGEKKLRALPYKKADGSLDKELLRTALSRWEQVAGFETADKAKALAKLKAAAVKAGLASDTNKAKQTAEDVADAKEVLAAHGLSVLTAEELEALTSADTEQVTAELEETKDALAEVERILLEREAEADELIEQVTELQSAAKSQVIEMILLLQNIAEDEVEAKTTELSSKDDSFLEGVLTSLKEEAGQQLFVSATVPTKGLSHGGENDKTVDKTVSAPDSETLLAAYFGSTRARRKVVKQVNEMTRKQA